MRKFQDGVFKKYPYNLNKHTSLKVVQKIAESKFLKLLVTSLQ